MSQTTGPYNLTPGTAQALPMPGNSPWESFVVANLSPYVIQLNIDGQAQWLAPWTENVYPSPSSHNPPTALPSIPSGTTPAVGAGAQLQVTWYGPGETPKGAWPIPLIANAIAAAIAGLNFTAGALDVNLSLIEGSPPLTGAGITDVVTCTGVGNPIQAGNNPLIRGVTMIASPFNANDVAIGFSSGSIPVPIPPGAWGPGLPLSNTNLLWVDGPNTAQLVLIGV